VRKVGGSDLSDGRFEPPLVLGGVEMVSKPNWMKQDDWTTLLQSCGGIPRCAVTGETDDLSVDHIIPVYNGGEDKADNYQFLKKSINCRKGIHPDSYWSRHFYFDDVPNLQACRAAQRGVYQEVLAQADWFGEPATGIARLLYLFPMVVGSGKTLSVLMAACAYNQVIKARWGAARRADRVLVLVKERAIRDQLDEDLKKDATRYKILATAPRVMKVTRGSQFDDESTLSQQDVVIACIQQLWDGSRKTLPEILHRFPVIFIDEPHFAADRVLAIVEAAKTSVCFGGTGTPIDGAGVLLSRMIRVFAFGYQDADEQDRSMKYLSASNWQNDHLLMAELEMATLLQRGQITNRNDTDAEGYGKNFEPAKSVATEVILRMERCDNVDENNVEVAPHRRLYDPPASPTLFYPLHAMIGCDNVRFANHLVKTINQTLEADRRRFPREKGWHAEVVHCEGDEPDNSKRADKPLSPGHSWLRASKQPGYRLDRECSRILLVVGMGREGVNNPLCGVVGITSDHASQIEVVQRIVGRQVRSVVERNEDGIVVRVPPAELDMVTIITHEAFKAVTDALKDGIDFVVNMEKRLEEMLTVLNLQQGKEPDEHIAKDPANSLPFADRLQIAAAIGADPDIDDDELLKIFVRGNEGLERPVADWIQTVRDEPWKAAKRLNVNVGFGLTTIASVLWEGLTREPSDRQLMAFLRAKYPALAGLPISDSNRPHITTMFKNDADAVSAATPPLLNADGSVRNIDHIRKNLAFTVARELGHYYVRNSDNDRERHKQIGRAIKIVLGVPDKMSAGIGGPWDITQCHLVLERSDCQREMRSWVIARLIEAGCLPELKNLHTPEPPQAEAAE
jgi:hypothetical protein